ncbi:tetratricopeptide repeat protein [Tenacibaculum jejuense]|uniref:Two-component system sensor histidine kinase n=1 Tax=Tenacibaculum jejuense TaxID=584609 RepID=A0A238UAM4_9FLAO|nr:tetratricopeptide repeat protein [Tenacibaculum jejuense]SNR16247.1 Two-component system sensor histidine kinase [Tenacibaculum jejuense]
MHKLTILFLLFVFKNAIVVYSQDSEVKNLFDNKEYQKVIDSLTKKQATKDLTFKEYYYLSRSYGRTKQFGNGYILSNEIIRKAQKANDTSNILMGYQLKIEHSTDLNRIAEGVHLCDSIMPVFRKQDSLTLMRTCFPCGMLYKINNQPEKAYDTYKKITKPAYKKLTLYTNNFGTILLELNKHQEAIDFFKLSLLEEKRKYKDGKSPYININYHNIAVSYLNLRKLKISKIYLDSAYNSLTPKSELYNKKYIFDSYFLYYKIKEQNQLTSNYLDSIYTINELILQKQIDERILSISEADKNEKFLIKKVKYIDNELERTKQIILQSTLVFLSILFVLIIAFFIFRYRNIQSTYKNLLIDRTLSWVKLKPSYINSSLLSMEKMIENDCPNSVKYLSKFSKFLRLLLENSRKSFITITDEITTMKYFLEIQQIESNQSFTFDIITDDASKEEEILIPPMLIQPFIEIALDNCKNTEDSTPKISIALTFSANILTCVISDNGHLLEKSKFQEKISNMQMKELFNAFSKKMNITSNISFTNPKMKDAVINKTILILPYKLEVYD